MIKPHLLTFATIQKQTTKQLTCHHNCSTWMMILRKMIIPFLLLFFFCLPPVAASKPNNNQSQKPTITSNVVVNSVISNLLPSRAQELPIPADGQCLYKSIMLAYLLPVAHHITLFKKRLVKLIGKNQVMDTEESKDDQESENEIDDNLCWDAVLLQCSFLDLRRTDLVDYLRQNYPFTLLVKDMKQHMGIDHDLWGGPKEIEQIATHLQITIQEYTPNPDNQKYLTEPLIISPKNKKALLSLSIVQDNPTKEEAIDCLGRREDQKAQVNSIKSGVHRQHYRVLLKDIPHFLQKNSSKSTNRETLYNNQSGLNEIHPISTGKLPYFKRIKDQTGLTYMQEQKNAVMFANIIKEGVLQGDRAQLFKGLQLLNKIDIAKVSNPRLVMEKLLESLTCTEIEWEVYGIKRRIAKAMRPFVYNMYCVAQRKKKYIDSQYKEYLITKLKKALSLINEYKNPGNGLRFELDVVEAMLKALPDNTSQVDIWKNSIMNTIEGVKEKDPRKLFSVLGRIYGQLKEKQSKNWYEVVLYIDYYKEEAMKNINALQQLQSLLYYYKQPRLQEGKKGVANTQNSSKKWKKKLKKGIAHIDPTNPSGDWHILYAGIESMTYIVEHVIENEEILRQALENTSKKKPGLAYYFDFNKIRKLGVKANNWRLREKAFESALLLKNHPNESIRSKVEGLIQNYTIYEQDKRVQLTLLPFYASMMFKIEQALQKDWTTYKKGTHKLLSEHDAILKSIQKTLDNKKNRAVRNLENLINEAEEELEQTNKELDDTRKILENKKQKLEKYMIYNRERTGQAIRKDSEIRQYKNRLNEQKNKVQELKDQLNNNNITIKQLKKQQNEKEDSIKKVKNQLHKCGDTMKELQEKLNSHLLFQELFMIEYLLPQLQNAEAKGTKNNDIPKQALSHYISLPVSDYSVFYTNNQHNTYPFIEWIRAFIESPLITPEYSSQDVDKGDEKKDDLDKEEIGHTHKQQNIPENLEKRLQNSDILLLQLSSSETKALCLHYINQYSVSSKKNQTQWVPILISLPTTYQGSGLLNQVLMKRGFKLPMIRSLQQTKLVRFLFVLDGFDEIIPSYREHTHLPDKASERFGFDEWKNSKFIITFHNEGLIGNTGCLRYYPKMYLLPFEKKNIKQYIKAFAQDKVLNTVGWEAQKYQEQISQYPLLKDKINDPFFLSLILHVLPGFHDQEELYISRAQLYHALINQWIQRKIKRCKEHTKVTNLEQAIETYCEDLALAMFKSGEQVAESDQKSDIVSTIFTQEKQLNFLDNPLQKVGTNSYTFSNSDYQNYFVASRFTGNLLDLLKNQNNWDSYDFTSVEWNQKSYQKLFNEDAAVIRFMVDRLQANTKPYSQLQKLLFDLIEYSKKNKKVTVLAANSATLLCAAEISLVNRQWQGIQIPYARLDHAFLVGTNLSNSDCTGVSLRQAYLNRTQWQGANLDGISFGEYPYWEHEMNDVLYSLNGQYIATGSSQNIHIWNFPDRQPIAKCLGRAWSSGHIAWSPDSSKVAGISTNNRLICIWDPTSGKEITKLKGHTSSVNSIAWSPNSDQIASASYDQTVRVWNVITGKQTMNCSGHTNSIHSVTWSPDGRRIASGGCDSTVFIWDPTVGKRILTLKGHGTYINSIAWAPDNTRIASGSDDKSVRIWDTTTGKEIAHCSGHTAKVTSVVWISDSTRIVSASQDHTVRIWDSTTGQETQILSGHTSHVTSLALLPSGTQVASSSKDKTMRTWDARSSPPIMNYTGFTNSLHSEWSPDNTRIASLNSDYKVGIWDIKTGKKMVSSTGPLYGIYKLAWADDSSQIASTSENNTIAIWNTTTGKESKILSGHTRYVTSIAWAPNNIQIASGSYDNSVRIWSVKEEKEITTLLGHTSEVTQVAWSHDSSRLASGSKDHTIRIWDPITGKELFICRGHTSDITSLIWSPHSHQIASASDDNNVCIWNPTTGKEVTTCSGHTAKITSIAWSRNSAQIASASADTSVCIWNPTTGKEVTKCSGHKDLITIIAWTDDSRKIASGSQDCTLRIWDPTTGKEIASCIGHTSAITNITWIDKSQRIASASKDNTVRIWNPRTGNIVSMIGMENASLSLIRSDFKGTISLTEINKKLIKQRGGSVDEDDEKSDGKQQLTHQQNNNSLIQ